MAFTLHQYLLDAAAQWPDRPALTLGDDYRSFSDLRRRANAIASALLQRDVMRGDRIGIYMHRSFDSVASIYGIMQAGAAYVALDNAAPVERLAQVVEDCAIDYILVDDAHKGSLGLLNAEREVAAISWAEIDVNAEAAPVDQGVIEQDLCLVFYTSGSTGKPKGVAHSHRSMLSNVEWALRTFSFCPDDRFAHVTSHHFDLSWFELFVSMAAGASMELVPEKTLKFSADLSRLIESAGITVWCSVPSVLVGLSQRGELQVRDLSRVRRVHFAGERFPTKNLRQLMRQLPDADYVNMYGTTETHIAAWWPVPKTLHSDEPLPIGGPCSHVQLMVVDAAGEELPDGGIGELVIRGPSLMEGYWNLPERTAKAIVDLDISPTRKGRFYRSGDLVTRAPTGDIRIIGRGDRRVKVRGHLIDLDEVEKVILKHPAVLEAACYLADDGSLSAHIDGGVILHPGEQMTGAELRLHVGQTLPVSACPETLLVLEEFPRTGSGKVDRRGLGDVVAGWREQRRREIDGDSPSETIRRFLLDELIGDADAEIDEETRLVDDWIDSLAVAGIVAFIEEHYAITIPNADFTAENFETISAIARLVERLRVT